MAHAIAFMRVIANVILKLLEKTFRKTISRKE